MNDIPFGFCHCGCGGRTPLATRTNNRRGRTRGEPTRFIKGHAPNKPKPPGQSRQYIRTEAAKERIKMQEARRDRERAERIAAEKAREERAARRNARVRVDPAVQLYRETIAKRGPVIAARIAVALQKAKETVEAADARAFEARHRGRPKSAKRLPNLYIAKSPDALIAAVSEWHGER